MAENVKANFTFTFWDGEEDHEFPVFKITFYFVENKGTTFEVEGVVGDYLLLYKRVNQNLKIQSVSSANMMIELFDVDVNLVSDVEIIRGFNYSNCRTIDYTIAFDMNKEESYIKSVFALENTFEFECQGYHPNNP